MAKALVINKKDNVATVLEDLKEGEEIDISVKGEAGTKIVLRQRIPFGHKLALRKIEKGEAVIKYGEEIGRATEDIDTGQHVHIHNVESLRGRGDLR